MKTYLVGGAVRDRLLHRVPADFDYVVTDTTHDELIKLGFIPVGRTFGIYLHPKTRDEYILAPDLSDDLGRRDLTINAMALGSDENVIDPFNGQEDLRNKILRHIKKENLTHDPIRILRIFRLHASLPDFSIADSTAETLKAIRGEWKEQSNLPDRLWNELYRALKSPCPDIFFSDLVVFNYHDIFFPEIKSPDIEVLKKVSQLTEDPVIRFAVLRLKRPMAIPNEFNEAAELIRKYLARYSESPKLTPEELVELFYDIDAFRKPQTLLWLATVQRAIHDDAKTPTFVNDMFQVVKEVGISDVPSDLVGKAIGNAIRKERILRLKQHFHDENHMP